MHIVKGFLLNKVRAFLQQPLLWESVDLSVSQSCFYFRVVQVIKSLHDQLKVGNKS